MWTARWRLDDPDDQGRAGGQGMVRKVRRIDDDQIGALKVLHGAGHTQTERRFRFQQEANSLLALEDDPGTPRLLDTNAGQWQDKAVDLFSVMEWVDGKTLAQTGRMSLVDALTVFKVVLGTLQRCETLSLRHRDVKPDNVILRDNDPASPVLIDFGLAWQPREAEGFETPAGQEMGNRFLRLPEFAPGHEHRDSRSDLTLAIGLLYFMLTGRAPRVLTDAEGRFPHEAHPVPENVSKDERWPLVRRIFQVGFQPILDNRFQNASQIMTLLISADDEGIKGPADELDRELEALQALLESDVGRARDQTAEILTAGSQAFLQTVQQALSRAQLVCGGNGPNIVDHGLVAVGCELQFFAVRSGTSNPMAQFTHSVSAEQGRIAAQVFVEGADVETYFVGPLMDREGFEQAATKKGREIATVLVRLMRNKLADQA